MKMNKKTIGILCLVLVAALLLGVYFLAKPKTAEGAKEFTVTVVHADGSSKEFTYRTDEEYLGPVLLEAGLIQGEMGPYGLVISAVDGETASWEESQSYWALYVGEEYGTTGVDTTPVYDGSSFKLEYTIG